MSNKEVTPSSNEEFLLEQMRNDTTVYMVQPVNIFKEFVTRQLKIDYSSVEELTPFLVDLEKRHIMVQMTIINDFIVEYMLRSIENEGSDDDKVRKVNNLLPLLSKQLLNPRIEISFNNILNLWIQRMTMNVFPVLNEIKLFEGDPQCRKLQE